MATLNRQQFVEQVLEVVRDRFPVAKVARSAHPFSLRVNGQIASLENLYRSSVLAPEKMTQFIEQWMLEIVRASEGTPDLNSTFRELSPRIMPMVVHETNTELAGAATLTQPLVTNLNIAYVVDGERSLWYVSQETFAKWNVEIEEVHEQAIANLVARSDAIAAHAAQDDNGAVNLILFQTMDGFDAARILLPTLNERLREHLGSPFAAGIPNRDILLCFRNDEETVDRLRQQIRSDHAQMPHPVSDRLLLVTPDGIAPRD